MKFRRKDTGEAIVDRLMDAVQDALNKPRYGTSRDMGKPEWPANPACRCSPMQAMFCAYGHMLECHYPHTCREAQCDHYQRALANESES